MKEAYIGNQALLATHKVGFLASSKIAYESVLPTLDWATDVARRQDVTVVCGCHSKLERQAVDYLLKGRCGIIIVLHRGMYKQIPDVYQSALQSGRLLLVSLFSEQETRPSRYNAHRRNKYILQLSDELVISSLASTSSLYPLYEEWKAKKPFSLL
jgi:predicted Rossmann fold nucleotide-binding protein DprA/Smf involved in DNA uptake